MTRAVICGGSIAGLATAHALLRAGLEVLVLERSSSVSAAGAGLGLDSSAEATIALFGLGDKFRSIAQPMRQEINHAITAERRLVVAASDPALNINSTHWADIHSLLKDALPTGILKQGHTVTGFKEQKDKVEVYYELTREKGNSMKEEADVLIAADGSMSQTRAKFLPGEPRRYSGYCAWRGVVQAEEKPDIANHLKATYPDMGDALYFEMTNSDGHAVVYELPGKRLNWLWYINQQEPELKGASVTQKADDAKIAEMHRNAARTFPPALASLMTETEAPFLNAIYDREPLRQLVWGRVALIGEAAHPTTPHGLRSTNMAIGDAAALRRAFETHDGDVNGALDAYQKDRIPDTTREVLFSRWLGRVKQQIADPKLDWASLPKSLAEQILQRNMHSYDPAVYLPQ